MGQTELATRACAQFEDCPGLPLEVAVSRGSTRSLTDPLVPMYPFPKVCNALQSA